MLGNATEGGTEMKIARTVWLVLVATSLALVAVVPSAAGSNATRGRALGAPGAAAPGAAGDRVADAVIGQPDFTTGQCNLNGTSAISLCEPMNVDAPSASSRIYVNDSQNARTLGYPSAAFSNGTAAEVLIGQKDFASSVKCKKPAGPDTMCNIMGDVAMDPAGNLYVADRKNNRVLFYFNPAATDSVADKVFGQPDFQSNRCNANDPNDLCWPWGVDLDDQGNLFVSVQKSHRVDVYFDPLNTDTIPDLFIGGPAGVQGVDDGPCGPPPTAATLCDPRGVSVTSDGTLWVADTANSRIVAYLDPLATDGVADLVLGSPDFETASCNFGGVSSTSVCAPRDVDVYEGGTTPIVYVVDTANSRVLAFRNPFGTDRTADVVFGQPSFKVGPCNSQGIGPSSMCVPRGGSVDADGNLYVADGYNHRVLRFDRPMG
jgi:NHL repeat